MAHTSLFIAQCKVFGKDVKISVVKINHCAIKSDVCAIPSSKSCDENTHRENDAELGIVSRTVKDQSSTFCPIEDKLSDENCYNCLKRYRNKSYGLNIFFIVFGAYCSLHVI